MAKHGRKKVAAAHLMKAEHKKRRSKKHSKRHSKRTITKA